MLIEPVLGYKSTWRILSLLLETPRKRVSRKELFDQTKLGNAPLSQGLNRLVKSGMLIKEKQGKKEFYYTSIDNEYVRLIKELWEKEKKDSRVLDYGIKLILSEFLRGISEVVEVKEVILFGSWAKGTASVNSDIDLALVFEKDLKKEIEVTRVAKNLEKQFGKELQIHYFTEKSFAGKNSLINEIRKEGIWLLGR